MTATRNQGDGERQWKVAALSFLFVVTVQAAGWIYWFSGWRSVTDNRILRSEQHQLESERALQQVPMTLHHLRSQQHLTLTAINRFLITQGATPVPILELHEER